MKKLALKLDSLAVETFDPAPSHQGGGTVVGEQQTALAGTCYGATCETCADPTCQADCPSQLQNTCDDSCLGTCYISCGTCARTCYHTSSGATCYRCG